MRSACVLRESISLEEDEMRATTIRHQSFASRVRPVSSSSANAAWTFISAAILNRRSGTIAQRLIRASYVIFVPKILRRPSARR